MKRNSAILTAFLIILLLAIPALHSIAGGQSKEPAKVVVPGDWGNIDWQQFKGAEINAIGLAMPVSESYKSRLDQFKALTGITVNLEQLNDADRRKKEIVDFTSGMGEYDVHQIGYSQREEFAKPGYLEHLDKYLNDPTLTDKEWYDFDDYPKDNIASGYSDGKLVFIPFTSEFFLLWYRKDIFEEYNIAVPKTMNELWDTAEKLTELRNAGKIKEYAWAERGMPGAGEAGWNLFCTGYRFDFQFIDYENMTTYVNTPRGKEVLTYYTSMIKNFAPPGSQNWQWPEIAQSFKTEQVCMTTGGNASSPYLEDPKESKVVGRVGYAPPPMVPGGKDPLWVWGWAINKDSKNKGAAWLFVQWATSKNIMKEIAPEYAVPARASSYQDPDYVNAMPSQEFIDAQSYMNTEGIEPAHGLIHAKYAEGADIVSKEMSNILAGIKSVDQAAADAEKALMNIGYKSGR